MTLTRRAFLTRIRDSLVSVALLGPLAVRAKPEGPLIAGGDRITDTFIIEVRPEGTVSALSGFADFIEASKNRGVYYSCVDENAPCGPRLSDLLA